MTWQNAKKTADDWIARNLPADLHEKLVQLVAFPDDETCRFFYRDRDAGFHRMVTTAIAREARRRGAKTIYVETTRGDYDRWLSPEQDTVEKRAEFIEKCHRVLGSND